MENRKVSSLFGRDAPREGYPAGYGWLLRKYDLHVPVPRRLALVDGRRGRRNEGDWLLFDKSYRPEDDVYDHLVFALKYEGLDLHLLTTLFERLGPTRVTKLLRREPSGQYTRRLWFLYEWLLGKKLDLPDTTSKDYYDLLNPALQYAGPARPSRRHGIRNNLPGTVDFCPLVHRTPELDRLMALDLASEAHAVLKSAPRELMNRAAAFLLLADSRASFAIEGERPPDDRVRSWAAAIGQAGSTPLSRDLLEELQRIIIPRPPRGLPMGFRTQEGFIGDRDRVTHAPLPSHISAKATDVPRLLGGLLHTAILLSDDVYDPVLAAASIAFGFVFIHPFVDGNGRLHRWLVHHILAMRGFTKKGFVFPVSSVILDRIAEYRATLEAYSLPRLAFIEWSTDDNLNVAITNDTIDLYRYFDATPQALFLYDCVRETVETSLPAELEQLRMQDEMKSWLEREFEFPDATDTLLIGFLRQGNGTLSARARKKEFRDIPAADLDRIEMRFREVFGTG
ncbi:MAG: Fic family protein [Bacteroidetes bacterium]|nr:Fic family protein [Bacteroidota bacterium]